METVIKERYYNTKGVADIVDITDDLRHALQETSLKEGSVLVFVVGSTAGITTCEYEPGLVKDLKSLFEKLIPARSSYVHDATWGDANGFSHLRASLLGSSLSVPFAAGKMILGTWQQIVLIDFDNRPRKRRVVIQFTGRE